MSYEHDIFISYRRSSTAGEWVKNHLAPCLEARLNDVAPRPVRIFYDLRMADGVNWPAELKRQVRNSKLLLAVWSADYFRSAWCVAEWRSFREREALLGLFSDDHTQGLVYPVRYADGDYFHPEARLTLCRKDFSHLNYPYKIFVDTPKYIEFDELVKGIATDLVARLDTVPAWRADFPIVEPEPLPPAPFSRPVI